MRQVPNQSPTQIELIVSTDEARLRLDQFLAKRLPEFSRSRLQQLIRDGFVLLNNSTTRPRQTVRGGDKIQLTEPPLEKIETLPEQIPLEILFEDNDLVVVNKPAGLVVHPGAGHREHTLVNALLNHCSMLSGIGGKERPGIVHRLDKETSGCLVVAKNDAAHRGLSKQFADRTVEKIYLALVTGRLRQPAGVIEEKIGRHPVHRQRMSATALRGRVAKTEYRVVRWSKPAWSNARYTLAGPIRFGCIFIISVTRFLAIKSTRRVSEKIFHGKCCTLGSSDFAILAPRNGKILRRRYPTILTRQSREAAWNSAFRQPRPISRDDGALSLASANGCGR